MINENIETTKADANANVIAHMDKAQARFMEARVEKIKAEKIPTLPAPPPKAAVEILAERLGIRPRKMPKGR